MSYSTDWFYCTVRAMPFKPKRWLQVICPVLSFLNFLVFTCLQIFPQLPNISLKFVIFCDRYLGCTADHWKNKLQIVATNKKYLNKLIWPTKPRRWETQQLKVFTRRLCPRCPNPFNHIPFLKGKGNPFIINFMKNATPFIYLVEISLF